ncbi:MAG: cobyrinate a,c-diamide synthase [Thermodesulfobacteriota bacterium]
MHPQTVQLPRIFMAGLRGGSGKTIMSIGLIRAWRKSGRPVSPFKKGPDYIDAGWLALAAGRPCYNLDTFLVDKPRVLQSFLSHTRPEDIAVIEGNRGLYDGIDPEGSTSSAEVAKLLSAPVILCVDCTKTTRTMAAVISGCIHFDSRVRISGVILNRIAGSRHEKILRESIESHCGIPVVGAVPKLDRQQFPERHMGLVPTPEHALSQAAVDAAAEMALNYLDLDSLADIALNAGLISWTLPEVLENSAVSINRGTAGHSVSNGKPRIGILRDSAFQFYYPDNIEALIAGGAEPVFINACKDAGLPPVDGLYIGGGFPETHARALCRNLGFIRDLKAAAEAGLPIYAECGGLMYLGESLVVGGTTYPMAGVLPIVFGLCDRPQGLGYTLLKVDGANPYFPMGTEIRGHEFRYSKVLEWRGRADDMVLRMRRGIGFIDRRDGITYKNVFATYTHIHALGMPTWAESMVANAAAHRKRFSS